MNSQYLLEAIVDPRFAGAACAGNHDLFDPRAEDEDRAAYRDRAALARAICGACPILARCAAISDEHTRRDRAGFTYAGTTYASNGNPIRPRKATA